MRGLYRSGSFLTFLSFLIVILLIAPQAIFGADREPRGERIPGQYIVVFKDSVADVDSAEVEIVTHARGERLASYRSALKGFAARFSEADLSAVAGDPRVAFVSEDREVSIADARPSRFSERGDVSMSARRSRDPVTPSPSPSPAPSPTPTPTPTPPPPDATPSGQVGAAQLQPLPTGINRIGAGGLTNKGAGVDVAVIDTGIFASHPDLSGKVVGGKNCTQSGGSYIDQNGHGTHVAGTIGALDNSFGVVGVAPETRLWAVRVLDKNGNGTWSTVICGLDFVTSKAPKNGGPIRVANLSLGGGGVSDNNCGNSNNDPLHKAICRARDAGVTIVVAAGNSGASAANFIPAAYNDAVITVSALADSDGMSGSLGSGTSYGSDDTFASFSNWGTPVDVGAPGVYINSTWIGNGYKSISGTSMASPHVAGAAALYIAGHPGALWSDVRSALISAGESLGSGHTDPSGRHLEPVLNVSTF